MARRWSFSASGIGRVSRKACRPSRSSGRPLFLLGAQCFVGEDLGGGVEAGLRLGAPGAYRRARAGPLMRLAHLTRLGTVALSTGEARVGCTNGHVRCHCQRRQPHATVNTDSLPGRATPQGRWAKRFRLRRRSTARNSGAISRHSLRARRSKRAWFRGAMTFRPSAAWSTSPSSIRQAATAERCRHQSGRGL